MQTQDEVLCVVYNYTGHNPSSLPRLLVRKQSLQTLGRVLQSLVLRPLIWLKRSSVARSQGWTSSVRLWKLWGCVGRHTFVILRGHCGWFPCNDRLGWLSPYLKRGTAEGFTTTQGCCYPRELLLLLKKTSGIMTFYFIFLLWPLHPQTLSMMSQ